MLWSATRFSAADPRFLSPLEQNPQCGALDPHIAPQAYRGSSGSLLLLPFAEWGRSQQQQLLPHPSFDGKRKWSHFPLFADEVEDGKC